MKTFLISTALGTMLIVGGVALAQQGPGDGPGPRHGLPGDINKDGRLTKAELTTSLEKKFAERDMNGDGKITKEEREALREKHFDDRFAKMDTDGNGQISKAEMKAMREKRGERLAAGESGQAWSGMGGPGMGMRGHAMMGRGFDADRDGTITRAEFMARPMAMFEKADVNKDGVVTTEEAKAAHARFGGGHGKGWGKDRAGPGGDMPMPPSGQ